MHILLIGYGKMGRTIEALAREHGHTTTHVDSTEELKSFVGSADAAIEFTQPDAAVQNYMICFEKGIPVVSGTTGWLEHQNEVEASCQEYQGTFFYASNFSIGVNLFFKLNRFLAKLMSGQQNYTPRMQEIHHVHKKDEPSGTAITLAEGIIGEHTGVDNWTLGSDVQEQGIGIESIREGEVPGTHHVFYTSEEDQLMISHEAFSRKGFALGALRVAEWIPGKSGILSMEDYLSDQFR